MGKLSKESCPEVTECLKENQKIFDDLERERKEFESGKENMETALGEYATTFANRLAEEIDEDMGKHMEDLMENDKPLFDENDKNDPLNIDVTTEEGLDKVADTKIFIERLVYDKARFDKNGLPIL